MVYFNSLKNFIEENEGLIENGTLYEIADSLSVLSKDFFEKSSLIFSIAVLKDSFDELGYFLYGDYHLPYQQICVCKNSGEYSTSINILNVQVTYNSDQNLSEVIKKVRKATEQYMNENLRMPKEFISIILDKIKVYFPLGYMMAQGITSPGSKTFSLIEDQ